MEELKTLIRKYKDVIPYLFFGVCTTVVNVAAYWLSAHVIRLNVMLSTVIAWVLAVLFAYITNRKWVFKSIACTNREIMREILSFFGCRVATGVIDWLCMFVFVELMGLSDVIIKVMANILVIVLNYIASKFVIFRRTQNECV